jgi:hypothetical protein
MKRLQAKSKEPFLIKEIKMSEHSSSSVGLEEIVVPELSPSLSIKELDQRENDGLNVRLLWDEITNTVWVDVVDVKRGGAFILPVNKGENPMDVFHHPFAYATGSFAVAGSQKAA